jgi:hypothetical protein
MPSRIICIILNRMLIVVVSVCAVLNFGISTVVCLLNCSCGDLCDDLQISFTIYFCKYMDMSFMQDVRDDAGRK